MTIEIGRRRLAGLVLAFGLVIGSFAVLPASRVAAAGLPTWTGGVSLYRDGVFTTQRSWLWCTAADVQIMRNIVERKTDHTTSNQRRYFDWMRERNRYDLPLSAGVDAAGWAAGLRHYVDDRYRLVASKTFEGAIRSAVKRLRLTGLPVALAVSHGNHGWILTGFRATADPARTSAFRITSVRVTGPLYGLQSKNGYDMPPNTKLTTAELRRFFTPWRYAPKRMVWDGRYVSIQPIPVTTTTSASQAATPPDEALPIIPIEPDPTADAADAAGTVAASPVIGPADVIAPEPVELDPAVVDAIVTESPVADVSSQEQVGDSAESTVGLVGWLVVTCATAFGLAIGRTVRRRP